MLAPGLRLGCGVRRADLLVAVVAVVGVRDRLRLGGGVSSCPRMIRLPVVRTNLVSTVNVTLSMTVSMAVSVAVSVVPVIVVEAG